MPVKVGAPNWPNWLRRRNPWRLPSSRPEAQNCRSEAGDVVERTYLFVEPEEGARVKALGARWDGDSKRWYIERGQPSDKFARWILDKDAETEEEQFTIVSSQAYVAATTTACQRCHADMEVICIYCESGTVSEEPLRQFTVSHLRAMDEELARQLTAWPNFRKTGDAGTRHQQVHRGDELFANHCPHCGTPQDDLYLHSEPGQVFFDIPGAAAAGAESGARSGPAGSGVVSLSALEGEVQLGG